MPTTDLDDFIPPAPSMQAPGFPSFEASPWDTYEPSSTSQGECPTIITKQTLNSWVMICCIPLQRDDKRNQSEWKLKYEGWEAAHPVE